MCFEDTAILVVTCAMFWVLAGFKFITSCSPKFRLPFSRLHGCKLVTAIFFSAQILCSALYVCLYLHKIKKARQRHTPTVYTSMYCMFVSHLYLSILQLLVFILLVTAVCDLAYTIYQDVTGDYGGVAQYLYLSSSTLAITMASAHTHTLSLSLSLSNM